MKIELLSHFGDDLMVVNAARVSYGKSKEIFDEKDGKLIRYLVDHKHIAPFRHPQLQFRIEVPIFVERQLFKHQVGLSANCLHGDSLIRFKLHSGSNKDVKIKDLYSQWMNGRPHQNTKNDREYVRKRIRGMKFRVLDEGTGKFTNGNIKDIFKSGKKGIYKITTKCGNVLKCSKDHKVWTDNGWRTINSGLSIGDKIGCNGTQAAGTGSYRDKTKLQEDRKNGLSVSEMAEKHRCSYHTIRKWLKIHNLKFLKEERSFRNGNIPWNKGVKGYNLTSTEKMKKYVKKMKKRKVKNALEKYSKMGLEHYTDHNKVTFNKFIKKYLLESNQIYQPDIDCNDIDLHHIIPARVAPELYFDINNVILISKKRHEKIHSCWQNELAFAKEFFSEEKLSDFDFKREGNILKVHFSEIKSIEYIGEFETYDIEVKGPHHNFVADNIVVHNSISGRYVDFSDKYYKFNELRKQSKSSKQGSDGTLERDDLIEKIDHHLNLSHELYEELCESGVAKEQARAILPLSLETQFIWTGSLLAFIHLWDLRLKPDSQKETRDAAVEMLNLVKNIEGNPFKYTLEAFDL